LAGITSPSDLAASLPEWKWPFRDTADGRFTLAKPFLTAFSAIDKQKLLEVISLERVASFTSTPTTDGAVELAL